MWDKFCLAVIEFFFKGLALLPFSILYLISDFLYFFIYYVIGYRKKVVRSNLIASFPDKTEKEITIIQKKFYRHFCDYIVETLKILHISDKETKERVKFVNPEVVDKLLEGNTTRPVFLYMGHYCNWEYVTSITLWVSHAMKGMHVYHPLSNKIMDKFFLKLRSRFNTEGIPMAHIYRRLIKTIQDGEQVVVGLIADQRPRKKFSTEWMTFLNQDTALITGGEVMGHRLDAHFVYVRMKCPKRGYYEFEFSLIQPSKNEDFPITKEFFRLLEQDIIQAPEYWLWSHKRWKYSYLKKMQEQQ